MNLKSQPISIKMLYLIVETGMVAMLGFLSGHEIVELLHHKAAVLGGFWCMVRGIVVLQTLVDASIDAAKKRFYACMIGILIAGVICYVIGYGYVTLFLGIALSVFATRVLKYYKGTRISSTQAGDVVALGLIFHHFGLGVNVATRVLETAVGILIALLAIWISMKLKIRQPEKSDASR